MVANQSASRLNRGLSSDFWWLRSVNHVKFTEEYVKHVLIKSKFFRWAKYWFAITNLGQKDSTWSRTSLNLWSRKSSWHSGH